jgi:sulfonate transport system substrate-binding protein
VARRVLAIAALLAALLPALRGSRAADETGWSLARLSYTSGWDAVPALIALERGFLSRQRITVSGLALSEGNALIGSLASGTTDFASVPQRTLLVMAAAKVPVRIVAMSGWSPRHALVVHKDSKIDSVAGLKGKVVVVTPGSEAVGALVRVLNANGLSAKDVVLTQLASKDLGPVFHDAKADAVCASEHFTAPLVENEGARVLLSHDEIVKAVGWIGALPLVASESIVQRDPDLVQRFVNGWVEALRYLQSEPDDAANLLRIFLHRQGVAVPSGQARAWVGFTRYDRYFWSPDDVSDAEYNAWGLVEAGVLKVQPELDPFVDNRFAQRAVETLEAQARSAAP